MRLHLSAVTALMIAALASACAYQTQAPPAPALNVYSSFEEKLPGKYLLVVDTGLLLASVKPSSFMCSAHSYPVDATESFRGSLRGTLANLVEELEEVPTPPTREQMAANGVRAVFRARAEAFMPKISFSPTFFSATANATVEVSAGITADGPEGRLFGTSASGQRSAQGDGGGFCEGGPNVLAEATSAAMKDLMERIGERLSNSPRLRAVAKPAASLPASIPSTEG